MRKSVLFIIEELGVNGATRSLVSLLSAIASDYDVSLFLFKHNATDQVLLPKNVCVLEEIPAYAVYRGSSLATIRMCLKHKRYALAVFRFLIAMQRILKLPFFFWGALPRIRGAWDVAISYSDGFAAEVLARRVDAKKKYGWVHQNYEDDPIPRRSLQAFKKLDGAVSVSEDAVGHFKNVIGARFKGKMWVVHNITDAERVRRLSEEPIDEELAHRYNIVTVGRVSPEKGYAVIPQAIKILVEQGFDIGWTIIGPHLPSHEVEIMAQAKEFGVADRLRFVGAMANPYPLVKACDCYVQTSRSEGWGISISEALVLGKPVVCTDLPVFAEQIKDCENGFLVEWTAEAFSVKIALVLTGKAVVTQSKIDELPFMVENVRIEFLKLMEVL